MDHLLYKQSCRKINRSIYNVKPKSVTVANYWGLFIYQCIVFDYLFLVTIKYLLSPISLINRGTTQPTKPAAVHDCFHPLPRAMQKAQVLMVRKRVSTL